MEMDWIAAGGSVVGVIVWLVRLEGRINSVEKDTAVHSRRLEDKGNRLMDLERKDASDSEILKSMSKDVATIKEFFTHRGVQALREGIKEDVRIIMKG